MGNDIEDDPFEGEIVNNDDAVQQEEDIEAPQPQEQEAPVAPPLPAGQGRSLRDIALDAVPPERKHEVIVMAADLGVSERQDATWLLFERTVNADESAKAAAAAAGRIEAATAKVGDDIYKQTLAAGKDLQSVVTTALHGEVVRTGKSLLEAINRSTVLGAQKIEKAALNLDEIAKKQQAANVRQWRDDFAAAARLEMKSRYMRSWSAIAGTLLLTLVLGAGLMFGGLRLAGKIFPWGWRRNSIEVCGGAALTPIAGGQPEETNVCSASPD
ncbi:MAG: hypothetical protein ACYDHY_14945 [Acidiferrobacterales bacterium]